MEYAALMAAILSVSEKIAGWLRTAQEIREAEKNGTTITPELRASARAAKRAAEAAMDATP